jgi:FKBP-type peptidyl-prolyl cis-trans isomerase
MKLTFPPFALVLILTAPLSVAQESAPAALPAPAPTENDLGTFKDEKERTSYALGQFFAQREKAQLESQGTPEKRIDAAAVTAGMQDLLSGSKSVDYAIGMQIAANIQKAEIDVNQEVLISAMKDILAGTPPKLDKTQLSSVMQRVQGDIQKRMQDAQNTKLQKALDEATAYLDKNKATEGVKVTESGLQYQVEKEGAAEGMTPTVGLMLTLNYKASVAGGEQFEPQDSATVGAPQRRPFQTFPKGVQEGLAMMKPGGKAKFWLPPSLGYGVNGRVNQVKPNAALVYEVELLACEPLPKPEVPNQPKKEPVTAVTPPISVEIPAQPAPAPEKK